MIFADFLKAVAQMTDRRFRSVLWRGIGLAILLMAIISAVFVWGVGYLVPSSITLPWIGEIQWLDNVLSWASLLLVPVLWIFLTSTVASAFTGIFLDEVSEAVEDRHYPAVTQPPRVGFTDALVDSLAFFGVLVGANLLAFASIPFVGPLAPVVFWAVNGFLLGREYYQLVAMRHLGREGARISRRRNAMTIWAAGAMMAVALTVPLANFLVPVLGAATFTHLFHRLEKI